MGKDNKTLIRILFVLYLLMVAYLCFWHFHNVSTVSKSVMGIPLDKVVHFLMFLPFPLLSYASYSHRFKGPWQAIAFILVIFLLGCAVAGGTEYVQSKLPYRTADPADFRADAIALCISSLAVFIWDMKRVRK